MSRAPASIPGARLIGRMLDDARAPLQLFAARIVGLAGIRVGQQRFVGMNSASAAAAIRRMLGTACNSRRPRRSANGVATRRRTHRYPRPSQLRHRPGRKNSSMRSSRDIPRAAAPRRGPRANRGWSRTRADPRPSRRAPRAVADGMPRGCGHRSHVMAPILGAVGQHRTVGSDGGRDQRAQRAHRASAARTRIHPVRQARAATASRIDASRAFVLDAACAEALESRLIGRRGRDVGARLEDNRDAPRE